MSIPTTHAPTKAVLLHLAQKAKHATLRPQACRSASFTLCRAGPAESCSIAGTYGQYCPRGLVRYCWPRTLPSTPRSALKQQKLHDHVPGSVCASASLHAGVAGIGTQGLRRALPEPLAFTPCPGQLSSLPQHGFPSSSSCDLCYPVLLHLLLLFLTIPVQAGKLVPCVPRVISALTEVSAPHLAALWPVVL